MRQHWFLSALLLPVALSAQILPPSSWAYRNNTGRNSVIAVNASTNPRIGSQALRSGDAIGVFFRRNDTLVCGGYSLWRGQNLAVTAWGDDDQTQTKDGFAEGEEMYFRIWDAQGGKVYSAAVQYLQGTSRFVTNGIYVLSSIVGVTTHVEDYRPELPAAFSMSQNFPNPFNPHTSIRYHLPALLPDGKGKLMAGILVTLRVFNVLGGEVATLVNESKEPGSHVVHWNASQMPSGIYFYRVEISTIESGGAVYMQANKMVLEK